MFAKTYIGRRVLITGHTGFKGSWLTLWLHTMGAKICGMSLDPSTQPNHWDLLQLPIDDRRVDIRDAEKTYQVVEEFEPEIIFHLAAQPLVRQSYRNPLETWSTNVMGTANVLDAARRCEKVQAIVAITTDKVYANQEWCWGYRESDRLGGHDPYSASKACCELIADSYRKAFFQTDNRCLIATVRAGNVIGGGDWSTDRLIPDVVRATASNRTLEIRSSHATRPWQHVLESLSGYLMVGQHLLKAESGYAIAWNFGPEAQDNRQVVDILMALKHHWPALNFEVGTEPQPHEANLLYLDNTLAKTLLKWQPIWTLEQTLAAIANWYQTHVNSGYDNISGKQLTQFCDDAVKAGAPWAQN